MRRCFESRCQGDINYNAEGSFEEMNHIEASLSDGKRAYANWTQTELELELEGYNEWLDERALEAQQAMDEDEEYQKQYDK
tara:strand:- start:199 stop:441 length:243 start_codon:yes stop_codon:yes gene_type:complete